MAVTLRAENQSLLTNSKFSYLNTNYLAAASSIVVVNSAGFSDNDYLLLGELGNETSEIVQISSVVSATHTLNLVSVTKFAHSESTKVAILPYNKIRFYHTTSTAFTTTDPVTGYIDIQVDSIYTYGYDTTNTTGYGWFVMYNVSSAKATQNSNYIPYTGFAVNSVKKIIEDFYSQLTITEQKLLSNSEVLAWLSEAYATARTELNLVNKEFNTQDAYTLTTSANLTEYSLPTNLDHVISLWDDTNSQEIDKVKIEDIDLYNDYASNRTKYYIRGNYIGIVPTPDSSSTFIVRYTTLASSLSSYSDTIDLPSNNFYCLKDFMMFRASPRLKRGDGMTYYKLFFEALGRMKISSKRDGGIEQFGIADSANV